MASGLSMPVGLKRYRWQPCETAINAMRAAAMPHRFVGINRAGQVCLLQTRAIQTDVAFCVAVKAPNYGRKMSRKCAMTQAGLKPSLMVDCSHGNS